MNMVRYIIALVSLIIGMACTDEDGSRRTDSPKIEPNEETENEEMENLRNKIVGKWEIIEQCGGVAGCVGCEDFLQNIQKINTVHSGKIHCYHKVPS